MWLTLQGYSRLKWNFLKYLLDLKRLQSEPLHSTLQKLRGTLRLFRKLLLSVLSGRKNVWFYCVFHLIILASRVSPALLTTAPNATRMRVGGAGIRPTPNDHIDAVSPRPSNNSRTVRTVSHSAGVRMSRKRALVVDGKSLTWVQRTKQPLISYLVWKISCYFNCIIYRTDTF